MELPQWNWGKIIDGQNSIKLLAPFTYQVLEIGQAQLLLPVNCKLLVDKIYLCPKKQAGLSPYASV
jgi:hypothetical protein